MVAYRSFRAANSSAQSAPAAEQHNRTAKWRRRVPTRLNRPYERAGSGFWKLENLAGIDPSRIADLGEIGRVDDQISSADAVGAARDLPEVVAGLHYVSLARRQLHRSHSRERDGKALGDATVLCKLIEPHLETPRVNFSGRCRRPPSGSVRCYRRKRIVAEIDLDGRPWRHAARQDDPALWVKFCGFHRQGSRLARCGPVWATRSCAVRTLKHPRRTGAIARQHHGERRPSLPA